MANIPLVDLKANCAPIRKELDAAIKGVVDSCAFILGPDVEAFEREWAQFVGVKHAVSVSNGTRALQLALEAYGIGQGDEVITVANTFVATVSAIADTGATPVLVDIDPDTYHIDVNKIEKAITKRTRAILPVHLYGRMVDMKPLMALAQRRGLLAIEDACQAHGARAEGRRAGAIGNAAAFSFYPGKNLGAFGDGGMVTTNDDAVAFKLRGLRNYGQSRKYHHEFQGYNSRLDTIQAAVLRVKLKHLDEWNAKRRAAAQRYRELLAGVEEVVLPKPGRDEEHIYHIFAVQVPHRDEVVKTLNDRGIGAGIHYPFPIHKMPAYADLPYKPGDFPFSEAAADRELSLPIYPEITDEQLKAVAQGLADALHTVK